MEQRMISVASIIRGNNDRVVFDETALAELAESIRDNGLIQPIVVRPVERCARCSHVAFHPRVCPRCGSDQFDKLYEIVAGERRFRAATKILGWQAVPCRVVELDDEAASAMMLAENTSRKDLNPIEEARAYQERINRFGWDTTRIAQAAGVSEERVMRRLLLLALPPDVQDLVNRRVLPLTHAEELAQAVSEGGLKRNQCLAAIRAFLESPNMTSFAFREVLFRLRQVRDVELFSLDDFVAEVREEAKVTSPWGANAQVEVLAIPNPPFPKPKIEKGELIGTFLARYMRTLWDLGFQSEATVVGMIYEELVRNRRCAREVTPLMRNRGVKSHEAAVHC